MLKFAHKTKKWQQKQTNFMPFSI